VLAAFAGVPYDLNDTTDRSVTVYSLPDGTVINTFAYSSTSVPTLLNVTLSGGGTALGELLHGASPCAVQEISVSSGATLWCDTTTTDASPYLSLQLSPDGTLVAETPPAPGNSGPGSATIVYLNGAVNTAISGSAVGWIDNGELLVNTVTDGVASGANIYSPTGHLVSALPLLPTFDVTGVYTPAIQPLSPASAPTSIYSQLSNAIYSLTNGAVTWSSGSAIHYSSGGVLPTSGGAVSGTHVVFQGVFPNEELVLSEPY
jgi:hypothetical protein